MTPRARPLRVAWRGPDPNEHAGVGYMTTQLLDRLCAEGVELDCYVTVPEEELPPILRGRTGLTFLSSPSRYRSESWYVRTALGSFASIQAHKVAAQRK